MAKKITVPLGAPERAEGCNAQRYDAMQATRARRFKRAFPDEGQRLAFLEGRITKCRRERVIKQRPATA